MGCGASSHPIELDVDKATGPTHSHGKACSSMSQEEAAVKIQSRARGMVERSKVEEDKGYRQRPGGSQSDAIESSDPKIVTQSPVIDNTLAGEVSPGLAVA